MEYLTPKSSKGGDAVNKSIMMNFVIINRPLLMRGNGRKGRGVFSDQS
jgi:hypothetical protein